MSQSHCHRALPPLLAPFLRLPPEDSVLLVTSTLSCSATWLTALLIGNVLGGKGDEPRISENDADGRPSIVLVSWLRDERFWMGEVKRLTGVAPPKSNFTFIDLLTSSLSSLQSTQSQVISALKSVNKNDSKPLLIFDSPTALLATSSTTSNSLATFILTLRQHAHAAVLSCETPLPTTASPTAQSTPLDLNTTAFLTTQAHAARWILSCRGLDSGSAKDVSGVLRITRGGDCSSSVVEGSGKQSAEEQGKEMEVLYLVNRDGSVKVFGRGEG